MIYCIGNSHANFFVGEIPSKTSGWSLNPNWPSFCSRSIGAVLAYNFKENYLPRVLGHLNEVSFSNNDYLLLAVGEVDCRWHLPYQANKQERDIEDIVKECVDRFFESIIELEDKGYKVIGWGGHPSTNAPGNDGGGSPIYKDVLTRNNTSLLWNDYLKHLCDKNGIPFISIVRQLINDDGTTKMENFGDFCHLDTEKVMPLVISEMKKNIMLADQVYLQ